jgi:hypothetical protein
MSRIAAGAFGFLIFSQAQADEKLIQQLVGHP